MSNHEHPCRYCHEDMRLMADAQHEARCSSRPPWFKCHARGCGRRTREDLRRYVRDAWQNCCAAHFQTIGRKQCADMRRRLREEQAA